LDKGRHDPCRDVVEVYDHAEPPIDLEEVHSIGALSAWNGVVFSEVRRFDRVEDLIDVI
jgi:hypothetical protein